MEKLTVEKSAKFKLSEDNSTAGKIALSVSGCGSELIRQKKREQILYSWDFFLSRIVILQQSGDFLFFCISGSWQQNISFSIAIIIYWITEIYKNILKTHYLLHALVPYYVTDKHILWFIEQIDAFVALLYNLVLIKIKINSPDQ